MEPEISFSDFISVTIIDLWVVHERSIKKKHINKGMIANNQQVSKFLLQILPLSALCS